MPHLQEYLSGVLPKDEKFELLHLQNIPLESHPLVTRDVRSSEITIKNQHFFTLYHNGKAIYGLDIYVYLILPNGDSSSNSTKAERVIFVSKADTTGYSDVHVNFKQVTKEILKYLLTIDPNYYLLKVKPIERQYNEAADKYQMITKNTGTVQGLKILANKERVAIPLSQFYISKKCAQNIKTNICLFTRPAPQYLFPESSKNSRKHIIDGALLIKWWTTMLDELIAECFESRVVANIQIPGESPITTKRYLQGTKSQQWTVGNVFGGTAKSPAYLHIPLFPDDPKARFLHQLVEEGRIYATNLETFWLELQERQEFRLSVAVSVIGISGYLNTIPTHFPQQDELLKTASKKQFKYLKNYITAEEYDTEEGALDAYTNIKDFLSARLNRGLVNIQGTGEKLSRGHIASKRDIPVVSILVPRKKAKTNA